MHYCIHLFTEKLPNEAQIEEIMKPFDEDAFYESVPDDDDQAEEYLKTAERPAFLYDWYTIGGRYAGRLKLKVNYNDDDEYRWKYYESFDNPREGRLFHSTLLKEIRKYFPSYRQHEEDWFGYLGDDTYIRVDGARISDLVDINDLGCCGYIDIDGTANVREHWNGSQNIENPNFDDEYEEILMKRSNCFLTVLDIHN